MAWQAAVQSLVAPHTTDANTNKKHFEITNFHQGNSLEDLLLGE